jgi:hypothetical protein
MYSYKNLKFIGFNVSTSDGNATDLVTAAQIKSVGGSNIIYAYFRTTLADGYMGLGKDANPVGVFEEDVIPLFQDDLDTIVECELSRLSIMRATVTDINVSGYVVVR